MSKERAKLHISGTLFFIIFISLFYDKPLKMCVFPFSWTSGEV